MKCGKEESVMYRVRLEASFSPDSGPMGLYEANRDFSFPYPEAARPR